MYLDYQSLTVVILASTFGLMQVAVVNNTWNSPCTVSNAHHLSFVGNNYYCELGSVNAPIRVIYYFNDTLWDGAGCIEDNCCNDTTQPWFHRQLNQITQDDIEARICAADPFKLGSTLIDQLKLYI